MEKRHISTTKFTDAVVSKFHGRRIHTYKLEEKDLIGENLFMVKFLRLVKFKSVEKIEEAISHNRGDLFVVRRNPESLYGIQVTKIKLSEIAVAALRVNLSKTMEYSDELIKQDLR